MNLLFLVVLVPIWSGEGWGDAWVNGRGLILLVMLVFLCARGFVGPGEGGVVLSCARGLMLRSMLVLESWLLFMIVFGD